MGFHIFFSITEISLHSVIGDIAWVYCLFTVSKNELTFGEVSVG